MRGKNGATSFLPKSKKGGKVRFSEEIKYIPNREKMCLTRDQATQIYEEVERNELINIQVISQGIESERKVRQGQVKEENIDMIENPYQKAITNVNFKDESKMEQMINWSIFSDKIRYVDSSINETPKLTIRPLEDKKHRRLFNTLEIKEDQVPEMIFEGNKVKEAHFDRYEGIQSEISQVTRFDESTDLSTTYLGRIGQTRKSVIRAEESFPISGQGYTLGKLSDKTDCNILIDTGASQSYMSKSFYIQSRVLHTLPKFAPTTQRIQGGNGQFVAVLFIVPVIIEVHGHPLEVFTLVSEIHDNVDLVLGMKNVYELEGIIDMQDSSFRFLNRSIPFFSKEQTVVKPKERKFVKIEAPFIDEISGHAIVKMLDNEGQCTIVLKLKFVRNCASLDITNNAQETVILDPNQMLGILDLRSLGYYKIKQGVLQQNLSKCYHFESVEKLCEEFNAIINERKKEEEKQIEKDKYPWLDDSDERKYMTDREILEKHINLDTSCLTESEKTQVRNMIYEYRVAFSLRDEIHTCQNIEVDIAITDKTPFFVRPYHVREEDKRISDKEMKRLCYLGILKEGFSAYSSPVMLISRKMTQDKRVVTDFRHLNTGIAKNNLAYPLVKDTFTTLGNSKCKVLSVLDLKDAFHSLRLS